MTLLTGTGEVSPTGTLDVTRDIDLDQTSPALIKAGSVKVHGWIIYNDSGATHYVKLYNKATAPVIAEDTPVMTIGIKTLETATFSSEIGIDFPLGLGWVCTTGIADNNTGAPAANDCVANIMYV